MTQISSKQGAGSMHFYRAALNRIGMFADRRLPWILLVLHLAAIAAFGATTWVDSANYLKAATAYRSVSGFRDLYTGPFLWILGYMGPGTPLLWDALSALPTNVIWPILAVFQHGLSVVATLILFRSLNHVAKSPIHAIAACLLSVLPFYQAFNNAYLSEPISTSAFMVVAGLCITSMRAPFNGPTFYVLVSAAAMVAFLFRANTGVLLVTLIFVAAVLSKPWNLRAAVLAVALSGIGVTAFPVVRGAITGEYLMTSTGFARLAEAIGLNWTPSPDATDAMTAILPPSISAASIVSKDTSLAAVGEAWKAQGFDDNQVVRQGEDLARILLSDGWEVRIRSALYALSGVGLPLNCLVPLSLKWRDQTNGQYCDYYNAWYVILASLGSTQEWTTYYLEHYFTETSADIDLYKSAWTPYVSDALRYLRDPLYLGRIPLIFVGLLFLGSVAVVSRRDARLAILLLSPAVISLAVLWSFPIGGPRYVYPLLPLYFAAISVAVSLIVSQKAGPA